MLKGTTNSLGGFLINGNALESKEWDEFDNINCELVSYEYVKSSRVLMVEVNRHVMETR